MLRWDPLAEARLCFESVAQSQAAACDCVSACTVPLVVHDYQRAAVLGTATLLVADRRLVLLTAAHVFDGGVRFGNLMVPMAGGHGMVPLAGARLTRAADVDIAVLDIGSVAGVDALLRGRQPAAVPHRRARRRAHAGGRNVMLSGYPAALSRFERGWLAARRLSVFTRAREVPGVRAGHADRLFVYGRIANGPDGAAVHTPELEGMSGAGIWMIETDSAGGPVRLRLDAVQSAYVHGRYLRGHAIGAAIGLLAP